MREVRRFRCQPCNTPVELRDETEDDPFASHALRAWQCPGCLMHVDGRPRKSSAGVSGLPLWLAEQFWTTGPLLADEALRQHLFQVAREALARGATGQVPAEAVEEHATGILLRVARALRAPLVPPHPGIATLLAAVEGQGAEGLRRVWRPFVERPHEGRTDVTFMVVAPSKAGMFAFEYQGVGSHLALYTCHTVRRALPEFLR